MAYTYLDLVAEVLTENGKPMTIRQIWDYAIAKGYQGKLESIGKTPEKTMNASLHKDIARKDSARFKQVSQKPALFDLK